MLKPRSNEALFARWVENGLVTREQIDRALKEAERDAPACLIDHFDVAPEKKTSLIAILCDSLGLEHVDLTTIEPETSGDDPFGCLPAKDCRRHLCLPFAREGDTLSVAMADPGDIFILEDVHLRTGLEVKPYLALPSALNEALDRIYGEPSEDDSDPRGIHETITGMMSDEPEAPLLTVVRPQPGPGSTRQGGVLQGIERLLAAASRDEDLLSKVLEDPVRAAAEAGIGLSSPERDVLMSVARGTLRDMIDRLQLPE
ncbi:hypothetical protein ACFL2T_06670 [Elusimicrobiota bacterium]